MKSFSQFLIEDSGPELATVKQLLATAAKEYGYGKVIFRQTKGHPNLTTVDFVFPERPAYSMSFGPFNDETTRAEERAKSVAARLLKKFSSIFKLEDSELAGDHRAYGFSMVSDDFAKLGKDVVLTLK